MESRVRDLEQLEEQDPEAGQRKKLGAVIMALCAIVALTLAIGVVISKAAETHAPERDPLDQLDRIAAGTHRPVREATPLKAAPKAAPAVQAADLTFERSLVEHEERPEVLAALAAAAREEDHLAVREPQAPARGVRAARARETTSLDEDDEELPALEPAERVQAGVPAGVTAGAASRQLEQARKHDKLIAAALPPDARGGGARRGSEGEFTLQVISYDSKPAAEAFASSLRARGHEAFVTAGEVEGRGRYYRVRLGPFQTKERAEEYRHLFETRERMNTIVVKRPKDD